MVLFIMAYIQLVTPNFDAVGYIGECEAFAEAFFRASQKEPTARATWDIAQFKHPGEEPPAGVIVPMFWDYLNPENNYHNDGHVAGSLGDGRIKSSPWQQGSTSAVLSSRAELERIYSDNGTYPLTYLGWSEDISNVRVVIKGETMLPQYTQPIRDESTVRSLMATLGLTLTDAQVTYYAARSYWEFYNDVIGDVNQGRLDALKKVDDLTAANQKLVDQLQALKVTPVVTDPSVTVTQSGLWAAFKRFLGL